jgi:hypothetical protein
MQGEDIDADPVESRFLWLHQWRFFSLRQFVCVSFSSLTWLYVW